jgi:N-acetylmuramoyl-L-alanine amidase
MESKKTTEGFIMVALNYQKKHIRINDNSRPAYKLLRLQAVVVHYTANPGADADDHFRYFDETIVGTERYAGAHIFVDRDKALELIPLDEGTFGANDGGNAALRLPTLRARDSRYPTRTGDGNANLLTIHIEMCLEADGTLHPYTIERTRLVIKYLQGLYPQLSDTKNRFVRHFDVTGKNCPKPFVEDEQKWNAFLYSVDQPVKTQSKPKEEVKVVENAIIINSVNDYPAAELLAKKINCPIYPDKRTFDESGDKVKHMYVVGGDKDGIKADKITLLAGKDRLETYAAVKKAL